MYFHTTGTTGRFLNEGFTQFEMQKSATQYCYSLWDHGIRPGDSMYFCFNFGMWIGLWSIYWGARNLDLRILAGGGAGSSERVRQILQHRPTIVVGTPTYLLHLVEVARQEGLDLRDAGVRMVTGGGEPGFSVPVTRQSLMDGWGATRCSTPTASARPCTWPRAAPSGAAGSTRSRTWCTATPPIPKPANRCSNRARSARTSSPATRTSPSRSSSTAPTTSSSATCTRTTAVVGRGRTCPASCWAAATSW